MKELRYLKNVVTLALDEPTCIGCGRCAQVCPHQVFIIEGCKAKMVDRDACMECGACARNCPVTAITVDAGVGCALGMVGEWLQEIKVKKIRSGGSCCD